MEAEDSKGLDPAGQIANDADRVVPVGNCAVATEAQLTAELYHPFSPTTTPVSRGSKRGSPVLPMPNQARQDESNTPRDWERWSTLPRLRARFLQTLAIIIRICSRRRDGSWRAEQFVADSCGRGSPSAASARSVRTKSARVLHSATLKQARFDTIFLWLDW